MKIKINLRVCFTPRSSVISSFFCVYCKSIKRIALDMQSHSLVKQTVTFIRMVHQQTKMCKINRKREREREPQLNEITKAFNSIQRHFLFLIQPSALSLFFFYIFFLSVFPEFISFALLSFSIGRQCPRGSPSANRLLTTIFNNKVKKKYHFQYSPVTFFKHFIQE